MEGLRSLQNKMNGIASTSSDLNYLPFIARHVFPSFEVLLFHWIETLFFTRAPDKAPSPIMLPGGFQPEIFFLLEERLSNSV